MTMKTLVLTTAVVAAVLALTTAADAAGVDKTWKKGWQQSVTQGAPATQAPVFEGRNVAAPATQGVEPYIADQIDANRRSSR